MARSHGRAAIGFTALSRGNGPSGARRRTTWRSPPARTATTRAPPTRAGRPRARGGSPFLAAGCVGGSISIGGDDRAVAAGRGGTLGRAGNQVDRVGQRRQGRSGRPRLAGGVRGGLRRDCRDGGDRSRMRPREPAASAAARELDRRVRWPGRRASGSRKTRPRPAGPRAAGPRDPAGSLPASSSRIEGTGLAWPATRSRSPAAAIAAASARATRTAASLRPGPSASPGAASGSAFAGLGSLPLRGLVAPTAVVRRRDQQFRLALGTGHHRARLVGRIAERSWLHR